MKHWELKRDMMNLLDNCTFVDSYGVYGSDFTVCKICGGESGAGVFKKGDFHEKECLVPYLESRYIRKNKKYNFI